MRLVPSLFRRRWSTLFRATDGLQLEWIQPLERRQLLSSVVVNSLGDALTVSGSSISLRAAIAIANTSTTPTTITFSPTVFAAVQTITLTNGILDLTNSADPITINGPAVGVIINGNNASGVLTNGGIATLSNLTITGGSSGGIVNGGNLTLTNSTITGNAGTGFYNDGHAPEYGLYPNSGVAKLVDDTISDNTISDNTGNGTDGGGIYNADNSGLTATNCTIYGNAASSTNGFGGGVYSANGAVTTLLNSTIEANSASAFNNELEPETAGGGIYNAFATLTLGNTIVAGNTTKSLGPDVGLFFGYAAIGSLGNNFIGISDPGGAGSPYGWISSDQVGSAVAPLLPELGPLANYGGLTETMLPQPGSPVINAGSNALIPGGITTDERGLPRIAGGTVDIGAVEVQPTTVAAPVKLTATQVTAGIALIWSPAAGAPSGTYDVYRGSYSTGESGTPLATGLTATRFTDPNSDLVSGHDYYYTVTEVSGGSQSAPSNEATAFAPGPYFAPSANYSSGFPSNLAPAFADQNPRFGSYINGNGTITIGGALQYTTPVSPNHFSTNFEFTPIIGPGFSLAVYLENAGGGQVGIFNAGPGSVTLPAVLNDTYDVTLTYNGKTLTVNLQDVTNTSDHQRFSVATNLPAAISTSSAFVTFAAGDNQPVLDNWTYSNSVQAQPVTPQIAAIPGGIALQGLAAGTTIYRGTKPGGESTTPLAVNQSGEFLDTTALPGVTYYYVAVTTIPGEQDSAASAEVSDSLPVNANQQLYGVPIGTTATWDGTGTIQKAFDGNLGTFFDPANGNLTNWVGLDLGKNSTITQISYAPRAGYAFRMVGGQFQVSSTPDFSSNVHTIYTITTAPTAGVLTTVNVDSGGGYRYIRYTGGTQWVNIAELDVFGLQLQPALSITPFTGTPTGVGGAWSPGSNYAAAFDGKTSTFFDPANGNLSNWVGLDLGSRQIIVQISYAPRTGYEFRMLGGQFQVSNTPDFSSGVQTVYTITQTPADSLTTVDFDPAGSFRYIRYTGGVQWVNIAEMQVAGVALPVPLEGTAIGAGGAWVPSSGYSAAFDGNFNTFFDPANGSLSNWVGLDLGSAQTITQISYVARAGYEFRMVGAEIQVSSTADFSSNVQTIYTVTAAPATGQVVTVNVAPLTARYIRYIGGTQWVNIAELEVDGQPG